MSEQSRFRSIPTVCQGEYPGHLKIPAMRKAVERVVEQVGGFQRGTITFDGFANTHIFHLPINQTDKDAVGPFFDTAEDIWIVVKADAGMSINPIADIIEGAFD